MYAISARLRAASLPCWNCSLSLSFSPSRSLSLALALSTQDRVCSLRAHCSSARTQRAPSSTPPATIVTRPWPWATASPHHNLSSLSPLRAPAGSPEELCTATTRWAQLLSSFSLSLVIHPSFSFVFSPDGCGAYVFVVVFLGLARNNFPGSSWDHVSSCCLKSDFETWLKQLTARPKHLLADASGTALHRAASVCTTNFVIILGVKLCPVDETVITANPAGRFLPTFISFKRVLRTCYELRTLQ